jgi:hypothetical protein
MGDDVAVGAAEAVAQLQTGTPPDTSPPVLSNDWISDHIGFAAEALKGGFLSDFDSALALVGHPTTYAADYAAETVIKEAGNNPKGAVAAAEHQEATQAEKEALPPKAFDLEKWIKIAAVGLFIVAGVAAVAAVGYGIHQVRAVTS